MGAGAGSVPTRIPRHYEVKQSAQRPTCSHTRTDGDLDTGDHFPTHSSSCCLLWLSFFLSFSVLSLPFLGWPTLHPFTSLLPSPPVFPSTDTPCCPLIQLHPCIVQGRWARVPGKHPETNQWHLGSPRGELFSQREFPYPLFFLILNNLTSSLIYNDAREWLGQRERKKVEIPLLSTP